MNGQFLSRITSSASFLLKTIAAPAFAISTFGQQHLVAQQGSGALSLDYDVVSVRQNNSRGFMQTNATADGFSATNVTVWTLIYLAYPGIKAGDQIVGLPDWTHSTSFNVETKMDENTARALAKLSVEEQEKERQLMLQAVLADRFKLRVHHEFRERTTFALEIAPGGPKLTESQSGEVPSPLAMRDGRIVLRAQTLDALATVLTHVAAVDRLVVDETGLKAKYDMALTWAPDNPQDDAGSGLSFLTALREQLGLKLTPSKSPIDTIIVDHVERPTEN
jgi:uncharacterized protein (TIGR03435 family)